MCSSHSSLLLRVHWFIGSTLHWFLIFLLCTWSISVFPTIFFKFLMFSFSNNCYVFCVCARVSAAYVRKYRSHNRFIDSSFHFYIQVLVILDIFNQHPWDLAAFRVCCCTCSLTILQLDICSINVVDSIKMSRREIYYTRTTYFNGIVVVIANTKF